MISLSVFIICTIAVCVFVAGVAPLQCPVSLSIAVWGDILRHMRFIFLEEWLPQLAFECLTNPKNWRVDPIKHPRCFVCGVGTNCDVLCIMCYMFN